jgi:hypothetical protein
MYSVFQMHPTSVTASLVLIDATQRLSSAKLFYCRGIQARLYYRIANDVSLFDPLVVKAPDDRQLHA